VGAPCFPELRADPQDGIERCHRALKNDTDFATANMAQLGLQVGCQILPLEMNLRGSAKAKLNDLRELLGGDAAAARAALVKHVERIEMEANGKVYVAKGNWNLLGMLPRDGAGGQNRTGYARLFRAALYQ
jgi:hypothetical protein